MALGIGASAGADIANMGGSGAAKGAKAPKMTMDYGQIIGGALSGGADAVGSVLTEKSQREGQREALQARYGKSSGQNKLAGEFAQNFGGAIKPMQQGAQSPMPDLNNLEDRFKNLSASPAFRGSALRTGGV